MPDSNLRVIKLAIDDSKLDAYVPRFAEIHRSSLADTGRGTSPMTQQLLERLLHEEWDDLGSSGSARLYSGPAPRASLRSFFEWLYSCRGYIYNHISDYAQHLADCRKSNARYIYIAHSGQAQHPTPADIHGFAICLSNQRDEDSDEAAPGADPVPRHLEHATTFLQELEETNLTYTFVSPLIVDLEGRGRRVGRMILRKIERDSREAGVHLIAGLVHCRNFYAIGALPKMGYSFLDWTVQEKFEQHPDRDELQLPIWFRMCKLLSPERFEEPERGDDPTKLYLQLITAYNLSRLSEIFEVPLEHQSVGPVRVDYGQIALLRGGWIFHDVTSDRPHDPNTPPSLGASLQPPFGVALSRACQFAFEAVRASQEERAIGLKGTSLSPINAIDTFLAVEKAYSSLNLLQLAERKIAPRHPIIEILSKRGTTGDRKRPRWLVAWSIENFDQNKDLPRDIEESIKRALAFADPNPAFINMRINSQAMPDAERQAAFDDSWKEFRSKIPAQFWGESKSDDLQWQTIHALFRSYVEADFACTRSTGDRLWLHMFGPSALLGEPPQRSVFGAYFTLIVSLPNSRIDGIINTTWRFISRPVFRFAMSVEDRRLRESSRRSQVVETAARNMSHNIGSHVLAYPSLLTGLTTGVDHEPGVSRLRHLIQYLSRRIDFVSQSVSFVPMWGEPMLLVNDLIAPLAEQSLVFSHLLRDEYRDELACEVRADGVRVVEFSLSNDKPLPVVAGADSFALIPGGATGAHAFYGLVENVLRNSALYGKDRDAPLRLLIEIDTASDEVTRLRLWTTWDAVGAPCLMHGGNGESTGCLACKIQLRIDRVLESPQVRPSAVANRGMTEMVHSAAILAGRANDLWESPAQLRSPLRAVVVGETPHLGYEIELGKTTMVSVLDVAGTWTPEEQPELRVLRRASQLVGHRTELLVVFDTEGLTEQLAVRGIRSLQDLPLRVLIVSDAGVPHLFAGAGIAESPFIGTLTPQELEAQLAASPSSGTTASNLLGLWLARLLEHKTGSGVELAVGFSREAAHSAPLAWCKFLGSCGALLATQLEELLTISLYAKQGSSAERIERWPPQAPEGRHERVITYDNHRLLRRDFYLRKDVTTCSSGRGNSATNSHLSSPPSEPASALLFLIGLIEAGLLEVFLLDERAAEYVAEPTPGAEEPRKADFERFSWLHVAGCHVPLSLEIPILEPAISLSLAAQPADSYPGIRVLKVGQAPEASDYRGTHTSTDILIVHLGLCQKMFKDVPVGEAVERCRRLLSGPGRFAREVVVTSARVSHQIEGHSAPSVDFGVLGDNLLTDELEVSKYHVVRALVAACSSSRE